MALLASENLKNTVEQKLTFYVRFYRFGISGKGRRGVFVDMTEISKWGQPDISIFGYDKFHKWKGVLPADKEVWRCELVYQRQDGSLVVRLLENETKRAENETNRLEAERKKHILLQAVNLEPIFQFINDFSGTHEELQAMMFEALEFCFELKKFAEEKVAKKGKLSVVKNMIKANDRNMPYVGELDMLELDMLELSSVAYRLSAKRFMSEENQLKAIVAWLERPQNCNGFDYLGNRWYKCGCCMNSFRLIKSEYKELKNQTIVLKCPDCGTSKKSA